MIYHVTSKAAWQEAQQLGDYRAASLASEGFIHASLKEQVAGVLQRYYKDQSDLLLLHIDESKITAPVKFEMSPSVSEEFPHIYGPLNLDAVIKTEVL